MSFLKAIRAGAGRAGSAAKTTLAVVGFATSVAAASAVWDTKRFITEESKEKKRVLVLPFHSLKLVEKTDRFSWLRSKGNDRAQEIEVQDLVDTLHEAASDPSIVAIFGEFGNGNSFTAGAADLEEIRNALRVCRESHRQHNEPNLSYEPLLQRKSNNAPMPLYAYTDTFESLDRPSNPDYFIASMFTHIHLQKQGNLNLFGYSSSVPFLRKALEKYGCKVHVYKHGDYKNAPNMFTETQFTKEHKENVETYLFALNNYMFDDIASKRGLHFSSDMWKLIQNSGTFTSSVAKKMGFVDFTPEKSPLEALLSYNQQKTKEDGRETLKAKWGSKTDLDNFPAEEQISLSDYRAIVSKRKRLDGYQWRIYKHLKEKTEKHASARSLLGMVGVSSPHFNFRQDDFDKQRADAVSEKIALLKINGTIDGKTVRKVVPQLRRIKEDTDVKCVVVRVDSPGGTIIASETLLQEFKDLPQKVVFSFGNVSASGGYYIASFADQIFASKNTITGSIGVFGVRLDLSGAAAQYGVKFGHISTSKFALSNNVFHPCTKEMHKNSAKSVNRAYARFKEVVASGRFIEEDHLNSIAGGRVWTGEQAKHNGLVDEIGGLQRAIAYARRTYTQGDAKVELYEGNDDYFGQFRRFIAMGVALLTHKDSASNSQDSSALNLFPFSLTMNGETGPAPFVMPNQAFDIFLTADENAAIWSYFGSEKDSASDE